MESIELIYELSMAKVPIVINFKDLIVKKDQENIFFDIKRSK